jgi:hypothetical protein
MIFLVGFNKYLSYGSKGPCFIDLNAKLLKELLGARVNVDITSRDVR